MKSSKFTTIKQIYKLSKVLSKIGFDAETLKQLTTAEELLLLVKEMLQSSDQYTICILGGGQFALYLNNRPVGIRGPESLKWCAFAKHPKLKVCNGYLGGGRTSSEEVYSKMKTECFPQVK